MIDRSELWQAGNDALRRLSLGGWRIWYADEEPETALDHVPAPRTAFNLRFNVVTDDGRFLNLRLLLPAEHSQGGPTMRDWIVTELVNKIRDGHLVINQ